MHGASPLNRTPSSSRALSLGRPAPFLALAVGVTGLVTAMIVQRSLPMPDAPSPVIMQAPITITEARLGMIAAPAPTPYVVEEGDTLFTIAAELDTSVEALIFANNLEDLDLLQIGQELMVPPPGSARQPADPARSLNEIAASYRLDTSLLAAYNGIPAEKFSQPIGREVLLFPPGAIPQGLASGAESGERGLLATIPFGAERPFEPFVYRVRPGDTLTDLSWRFGIDIDTILNNNSDMGDGDRIRIGDEILVLPVSGLLYRVDEGDTLSSIADQFGVDVEGILEVNNLPDAETIVLGMELMLPGAGPVYAPPILAAAAEPGVVRLVVPYRSQLDGTPWAGANCGPVSLAMGLDALGIKISSTEARRQVLNAQGIWGNNVGTLMDALAKVAANNGARPIGLYDGNGIAKWSLAEVREQLKLGRPVIVQTRFRALPGRAAVPYYADHYIILTGLRGDNFLYNDPLNSDGPGADRLLTSAQLEAAMNATDRRYAYAAFALAR